MTVRGLAVESCRLTSTVTNVVPIREISHSVRRVVSLSDGIGIGSGRACVVSALSRTREYFSLRRDTCRRIYAVEIRCKKCTCARARSPRKNPLSEQRGYHNIDSLFSSVGLFLLFARLVRASSICPSLRPNRIQKCRFHGKIRFAQT